jgi:hypothetical protein
MLKKELGLCSVVLHEGLQERHGLDVPKHKIETKIIDVSYLVGRGNAIQCAQRVGEQLRHASQRRVQTMPLRPLHGVVEGKDRSPWILWVCLLDLGSAHTSRPPLARVKSQDSPLDASAVEPPRCDASVEANSLVTKEDGGDTDPCYIAATTGDASTVSPPI